MKSYYFQWVEERAVGAAVGAIHCCSEFLFLSGKSSC
jgi:hypothetical protein